MTGPVKSGGVAAQGASESSTVPADVVSLQVLLQSVPGPVLHGGAAAQPAVKSGKVSAGAT